MCRRTWWDRFREWDRFRALDRFRESLRQQACVAGGGLLWCRAQ
jgi:hypothetical protein